MEIEDLHEAIDDLSANIDDLETALAPLLSGPLSHQTSKLPLLDQAKLYALATYSIESLIFSSLRLNGVDAKAHPVFQELSRVKEYFGKIKTAETGGANAKRNVTLDKEAAGRFVKAGLAGNERYDRERAERQEREKAGAKRKLQELSAGSHTKFEDEEGGKRVKVVKANDVDGDGGESGAVAEQVHDAAEPTKKKKRKRDKTERFATGYAELMAQDTTESATKDDVGNPDGAQDEDANVDETSPQAASGKKETRSKKSKQPKTSKEALESLLEGALDAEKGTKKKKRKKSERLEDERADEMK